MNFRTTIILALLAVAAGAGLFAVFQIAQQSAPDDDDGRRLFGGLKSGDIFEVEVERQLPDEQRVVLVRHETEWHLREPVSAVADAEQAGQAASLLAGIDYSGRIELTPQLAAEYGLEPPVARINFKTFHGTSHSLIVGSAVGLSNERFTYVKLPDQPWAYLVDPQINDLATADVEAYRSRRLPLRLLPSLGGVRLIRSADEPEFALRVIDRRWHLVEPVRMAAEAVAAAQLLAAIGRLEVVQFTSEDGSSADDVARYGFDNPQLTVELLDMPAAQRHWDDQQAGGGDTGAGSAGAEGGAAGEVSTNEGQTVVRLEFGSHANLDRSLIYVRVPPHPAIYAVSDASFRDIVKQLDDLRVKRVAPVDAETLEYLEIDIDGSSLVLNRDSDDRRWRLRGLGGAVAEANEISRLLERLEELEYHAYRDGVARGEAELGFDDPRGSIKWRHKGEREIRVAQLGRVIDGRQWVLESGSNVAGAVQAAAVDRLKINNLALHDRTVWKLAAGETISRLRWTLDDEAIEIRREDDDNWRMVQPVELAVGADRAGRLTELLSALRAEVFVDSAQAAIDYDLDKPSLQLTMWAKSAEGQGRQLNLVASLKDGQWYAMASWLEMVFILPKPVVAALRGPLMAGGLVDFDAGRVTQLELVSPDEQLILMRSGQLWTVVDDDSFDVHQSRPPMYLNDLVAMQPQQVATYNATDLASYGLDDPQWRIVLRALGGDRELLLSARGPAEGEIYATVRGSGIVSVLSRESAERLRRDRSYFRRH